MRNKTVNDVIFTQWLHDKFSGIGCPSAELSEVLVNLIITNDLDVDIVDLDQMYDDVLKYLRLNAPTLELIDFFRRAWFEYKEYILEQKLESFITRQKEMNKKIATEFARENRIEGC